MKEVYVIHCENENEILSTELLLKTIKHFDSSRQIIVTTPLSADRFSVGIVVNEYTDTNNPTLNYFKAIVDVDCDRAIYFKSDQLLTHFSSECWEALRNLSSIVTLKTRFSFSGETINPALYYQDNININNLSTTKNVNAVFFDFTKTARQLLGFCIDFSSDYNYKNIRTYITEQINNGTQINLPTFPEYIWPSWVLSYVSLVFEEEFIEFDFLENIDVSKQEYNTGDHIWSSRSWNKFLSYWISDHGQIKIENFIQSGLLKYQTTAWLDDIIIDKLQTAYGN
jgi:hypothetical protein